MRPLPSTLDIHKHLDSWKTYVEDLQRMIDQEESAILDSELAKYSKETVKKRCQRATKKSAWIFVPFPKNKNVAFDDISCPLDTCWYSDNPERVNDCDGIYRLLGTRNVFLCDKCITDVADQDLCEQIEGSFV